MLSRVTDTATSADLEEPHASQLCRSMDPHSLIIAVPIASLKVPRQAVITPPVQLFVAAGIAVTMLSASAYLVRSIRELA